MIFKVENRKFESEKERNLYYKFFAGYYFNELIPGYRSRLRGFYSLLTEPTFIVGDAQFPNITPSNEGVYVSFDNHPNRFLGKQCGEFADILIHDLSNNSLIGIEAKYLDDWNYDKDIVQNEKRLKFVGGKLGAVYTLLCLLVTRNKWDNVVAMERHSQSNYKKLKEHQGTAVVLLWESFLDLDSIHPAVREYLRYQLNK